MDFAIGKVYRFNEEWEGKCINRATGLGLIFYYFLNDAEQYRVTVVGHASEDVHKLDVNSTSGDQKTIVQMGDLHSWEEIA
jgi:hypothetical protein